ncbi:5'-3' exonuclease [Amycolatopsis keratiniphila]|uniref:5'-3' exonuclease n=1 Tax=Amycolatopsis keratiniphila TaxID=129921 RepID=UPI00087D3892|nr:5'-3' exonuclease H3TH domain-containing protein [Amycolatopsis keratiniphila]OLZ61476.1 flap endonuclease [Amycolatopsis keratiniphila subsp. nogabecina]SDU19703.1 5'-3' exonuclease [Amycolatopsis keratiniphila]
MTGPLALLDSASLYFRSFYALPDSMTAPDGTPVNAVRGFTDTIARILVDRRPSRLVACLDADWRPKFRTDLLPSYKAHRVAEEVPEGSDVEEVPDTLTPQVPIILELLEAFGIATAEAAGYEADDVIGALAIREQDSPVEVITGDRDLFQLVRREPTSTVVIYVGKGWNKAEVLGPDEIAEKYGIPAGNAGPGYADMAALRGDPSDGLPGVAGIGEKTAAKLITQFGSLQELIEASNAGDSRVPLKTRLRLTDAADYLAVAPTVVRVAADAPVEQSRPDIVPPEPADPDKVAELAERWNLGRSVERLLAALPKS